VGPALLACEATGERESDVLPIQFEGRQAAPQFKVHILHGLGLVAVILPGKRQFRHPALHFRNSFAC
jgi:hypothetical protein